jgi:hypothetical protein
MLCIPASSDILPETWRNLSSASGFCSCAFSEAEFYDDTVSFDSCHPSTGTFVISSVWIFLSVAAFIMAMSLLRALAYAKFLSILRMDSIDSAGIQTIVVLFFFSFSRMGFGLSMLVSRDTTASALLHMQFGTFVASIFLLIVSLVHLSLTLRIACQRAIVLSLPKSADNRRFLLTAGIVVFALLVTGLIANLFDFSVLSNMLIAIFSAILLGFFRHTHHICKRIVGNNPSMSLQALQSLTLTQETCRRMTFSIFGMFLFSVLSLIVGYLGQAHASKTLRTHAMALTSILTNVFILISLCVSSRLVSSLWSRRGAKYDSVRSTVSVTVAPMVDGGSTQSFSVSWPSGNVMTFIADSSRTHSVPLSDAALDSSTQSSICSITANVGVIAQRHDRSRIVV